MTDQTPTPLPDPEFVRERLAQVRKNRGYLLPNQGLMAAAMPDFQDAAAVFYKAVTLTDRHLTPAEREFLWLAILVPAEEHGGTHQVHLFRETGGTDAQAEICWRLVGFARGAGSYAFLADHWQPYFPGVPAIESYQRAALPLIADCPEVDEGLARLALIAVQTARSDLWALGAEIEAGYRANVPEGKMAEAMSLVVWPCGMNRLIEGAGVWLDLIQSGRVDASPGFRAWAEQPDQTGFKIDWV